jgi:carboxylate-amine ligase
VGIPRAFASYADYVEAVDQLLRCEAFPSPTFLWWDVRLQPGLGTVEVRVMDAQVTAADTGSLAALVQTIAHLELEQGYARRAHVHAEEVIQENRFLAARDGLDARFIDPVAERRVPGRVWLEDLLRAGRPHAQQLGCEDVLDRLADSSWETGAERQRRLGAERELSEVIQFLAGAFSEPAHF